MGEGVRGHAGGSESVVAVSKVCVGQGYGGLELRGGCIVVWVVRGRKGGGVNVLIGGKMTDRKIELCSRKGIVFEMVFEVRLLHGWRQSPCLSIQKIRPQRLSNPSNPI